MANTNQFPGLARGPIDHNASAVINVIANEAITMGSAVALVVSVPTDELLPRVDETDSTSDVTYGIVVGGDTDGIYGDGNAAQDDSTRAAASAGQGVVVVTQGRCLARVSGDGAGVVVIGSALTQSAITGVLELAGTSDVIIAFALNDVGSGDIDMIAVDVQRAGVQ